MTDRIIRPQSLISRPKSVHRRSFIKAVGAGLAALPFCARSKTRLLSPLEKSYRSDSWASITHTVSAPSTS